MIVVGQLTTLRDETAELTTPVVVALAIAGLLLSRPSPSRFDPWSAVAAALVFLAYGAPVVLSGQATFAGYIKLDDTATFLAFTDHILEHGRNVAGLAPSTYEAVLAVNLPAGYPIGAFLPLGIGAIVSREDPAWLFQPYLAFLAAMLALALYVLLRGLVESRPLRALAATLAAQPALLYAFSLWGGIKELAAAALLALVAAAAARGSSVRSFLPAATAAAACLAVLSLGGGAWIAPTALAVAAPLAGAGARRLALGVAAFACLTLALSLPALVDARLFLPHAEPAIRTETELGNLLQPLSAVQVLGIWPTGDFRRYPDQLELTAAAVAVVAGAAAVALGWAVVRRRAWQLAAYAVALLGGAAFLVAMSSPWLDAKALAIASPAPVALALAACTAAVERGWRVPGAAAAVAIAAGVLWSNALAYGEVWLAPRHQLAELETIGHRFAGDGPTLMTEYHPYGARHFLRTMDAEGAAELRRRPVRLRRGGVLGKSAFADLDEFRLEDVLLYRSIVLRRSPVASRPPSPYRLVWRGRFYEVWQRRVVPAPDVVSHLPFGHSHQPAERARCPRVLAVAEAARARELVAAVPREHVFVVPLARASRSGAWVTSPGAPQTLLPVGRGTLATHVRIQRAGRYTVWAGGSFLGRLSLAVDGRHVASLRHELNNTAQYTPLATRVFESGRRDLHLTYETRPDLRPGGAGPAWPLGPLVVSRAVEPLRVRSVAHDQARRLCRRRLDWVEVVRY